MKRSILISWAALCGCLLLELPAVRAAEPALPDEMLVLLGQPSVYWVVSSGTFAVTMPSNIRANLDALQAGYMAGRNENKFPPNAGQAECYWLLIANSPATYLTVAADRVTKTSPAVSNTGTAFAVSREGILLTNAHVIELGLGDLVQRPELLAGVLAECLGNIAGQLNVQLPADAQTQVARAIFAGLYDQHLIAVQLKEQRVQLFTKPPFRVKPELRLAGPVPNAEEEQGIPARVIAKGTPYPGRDVAVLRTTRSDDFVVDRDRLICLRLGDSDDVRPGAKIQAFGFPGDAFSPNMPEEARRLVSCQNGQVGQIKPLRGDMPVVFEMTADVNHGDSGGPVLDKHGRVIGLNVAGYPIKPGEPGQHMLSGHTLAVPVNVARQFLKQAGFEQLDPGPLTEYWERGLRAFADEKYAAAEKELGDLLRTETTGWAVDVSPLDRLTGGSRVDAGGNAYVYGLYLDCQKKQGKLKPPGNN